MISLEGSSLDAAWRQAAGLLRTSGSEQPIREQNTRELLHVALTITQPRQRLVYSRPINPAFALAEVIWTISGANDLSFLAFWNPRMKRFSDDQKTLHGAYGFRLGSRPSLSEKAAHQLRHKSTNKEVGVDQIRKAYEALHHFHSAHQVVLQMWQHEYDLPNPEPRSKDIPCNLMSHLLIRNGRLEWLQVMRSNDLIWGMPYDIHLFTTLQEILAGWLQVDVGTYTHFTDCLHIYDPFWDEIDRLQLVDEASLPINHTDLRIAPYEQWEYYWSQLVDSVLALMQATQVADLLAIRDRANTLPACYTEWVVVLTAEALRKRGYWAEAKAVISDASSFWAMSWMRWAETKQEKSDQRIRK